MKRRNIIGLVQTIANEQFHIFNRMGAENLAPKEGLRILAEMNQAILTIIEQGPELSRKAILKQVGPMDWAGRLENGENARSLDGSSLSEDEVDAVHSLVDYRKDEGLCIEVDVIGKEKNGKSTIALAILQHLETLGIAAKFDDIGDDTADATKFLADQEARLQAIKDQKIIVTVRTVIDQDSENSEF